MGFPIERPLRQPDRLQPEWLSSDGLDWRRAILDSVPPLRHRRGRRMPLILWKDGAGPLLGADTVVEFMARGIVPHCQTSSDWVTAGAALKEAGAPVVLLEGAVSPFPYSLLGDRPENWKHDFGGMSVGCEWIQMPCPSLFYPWAMAKSWLEDRLYEFGRAGVSADAVLMDWETPPFNADYGACLACVRCRNTFRDVLVDHALFARHMRQLWQSLVSSTIGGAVRKVFPEAIAGNWACYHSTSTNMVLDWNNEWQGDLNPGLLRASVPIAYGMTNWITPWRGRPQAEIDAAYAHLILRQLSADTANRRSFAPWLESYPWFARWVPEPGFADAPAMSRPSYREVLRHSWLRGIDGMQIFNTDRKGAELQAVLEVVDAQKIYDEMLLFLPYLQQGEPLNLQVPPPEPLPIWSGLRLGKLALLRATGWSPGQYVSVDPWATGEILLPAPPCGATYLLREGDATGRVLPSPALHSNENPLS